MELKITLPRDEFAAAIAWTAKSLPSRPTSPVLAGIRLAAEPGQLTVEVFDYEVSAQALIAVDYDGPAATVLLAGRMLNEIVKQLPAKPVELVADGTRATLTCGPATFTLVQLPTEEYPALPPLPDAAGTAGSAGLAAAIEQVAAACGRDDTLPALTGIRMEIAGDELTFVATDRYRLAIATCPWTPAVTGLDTAVLIPARTLAETARALVGGKETDIYLGGDDTGSPGGLAGFAGAGRQTTTRLLGGEYPKYQSLLPSEFTCTGTVPAKALAEAVKRVALCAARNTPIRLTFAAGSLLLEAGTDEEATSREVIGGELGTEVTFDQEEPFHAAFNPQYLLDGLSPVGDGTVQFQFTSQTKPALLTGLAEKDGEQVRTPAGYVYVLMPIRSAG